MDEEVEDAVGDVKLTDSQKSVATSNVYSLDFTDSSSEKHNSSGRETYVIEWDDSEDSDTLSDDTNRSAIRLRSKPANPSLMNRNIQCEARKASKASCTSLGKCSIVAQETYTQTSKTIIELAEHDTARNRASNSHTLETQTSIISITENKTVNYTIEICGDTYTSNDVTNFDNNLISITGSPKFNNSMEDGSSKFPVSGTDNDRSDLSENSSDDKIINIIDATSKDDISIEDCSNIDLDNCSDLDTTISDSTDIDEDSLECYKITKTDKSSDPEDTPKSVDNDVAELYSKLSQSIDLHALQRHYETNRNCCGTLTPLTEESAVKKESLVDLTPTNISTDRRDDDGDVLFTNAGIKVKVLSNDPDPFKLPPIHNETSPNNPSLNYMFSSCPKHLNKPGVLPCVYENPRERTLDRWEIGNKELASGESPLISGRSGKSDQKKIIHENFQLPPIHIEGYFVNEIVKPESRISTNRKTEAFVSGAQHSPISINNKIKELKMTEKNTKQWSYDYRSRSASESRSCSPGSVSADENRLCDAAERGSEALCVELLKRLRSHSWFEIADTMSDMPQALEKFWNVISEQRIADLIRQVTVHVESPRTQVARTACTTLASILRNTNYTKKPDFHEAMTTLLTKTGSFSRPVRRAANVALDDIVCAVDLTQAITALCIHGTSHKSPLVRCASARLLVVCCALGGGGRELLRTRPPSAATARRLALRCLASLLDDKNSDARKYAERLYSMLRPLANFEAYYLTDVNVELASRHMKKYDQLLLCGPPNEAR